MADLFTAVTTVITNILNIFGNVTISLLTNTIFQIIVGIILLGFVIKLVYDIVKEINKAWRPKNDGAKALYEAKQYNKYMAKKNPKNLNYNPKKFRSTWK